MSGNWIFFEENFNAVIMEQVIEAWNSPNGELPENALLLTFDDGYIDNYLTVFPELKEDYRDLSLFQEKLLLKMYYLMLIRFILRWQALILSNSLRI